MPTAVVDRNGRKYRVSIPEGADPNVIVEQFTRDMDAQDAQFAQANDMPPPVLSETGEVIAPEFPGASPELQAEFDSQRTLVEDAARGVGLGARAVVGAVPKAVAGLGDLVALPIDAVLPEEMELGGGRVQAVDQLLTDLGFPEPAGALERIVQTGGEVALTGGLGGAALAGRAAQVTNPGARTTLQGLGDEIGMFFANNPKLATGLEFGGGAGAQTGQELAQQAGVGPGGQLAANVAGGLAAGLAPAAAITGARKVVRGVQNVPGFFAETRAARSLQNESANPRADAEAALAAREGVSPARATGNTALMAKESRVRADNPVVDEQVRTGLADAERAALDDVANLMGPVRNPVEWQREVVRRSAPPDAQITGNQPDEMLSEAFTEFTRQYGDIAGYPVSTQIMQVEGGNIGLPEAIRDAIINPRVLLGDADRSAIAKQVGALLEDAVDVPGALRVGGPDDAPLMQIDSADLLKLRQEIRSRRRDALSSDKRDVAEIYGGIDDAITDVIESQLPDDATELLRALDARYANYKTVEDAVLRGAQRDLTPQSLQQSIRMRPGAAGRVARGDAGELGVLAEQGGTVNVLAPSTTMQQIERTRRTMDEGQLAEFKSKVYDDLLGRASSRGKDVSGEGSVINGEKILRNLEQNADKLRAAGYTDEDFARIRRGASELAMIQRRSPREVQNLLEDDVGVAYRLVAAIAGSAAGRRALNLFGVSGSGPSLVLSQFGANEFRRRLSTLAVDEADYIVREALRPENKELFAALMTRPVDPIRKQAEAARTINAFLARAAGGEPAEDE